MSVTLFLSHAEKHKQKTRFLGVLMQFSTNRATLQCKMKLKLILSTHDISNHHGGRMNTRASDSLHVNIFGMRLLCRKRDLSRDKIKNKQTKHKTDKQQLKQTEKQRR